MSRPPASNKPPIKDMYWFAHGGIESANDKCLNYRGDGEDEYIDSTSPKSLTERKTFLDDQKFPITSNSAVDGSGSSGPSSLDMKGDQGRNVDKRVAVEERRKQLLEAEQERNDAVLRKHMERDAALEARRNAQRSHISFAFGSSVPRNVESLVTNDSDKISKQSNASGLLQKEENYEILLNRRSLSPNYSNGNGRLEVDGSSLRPHSPQNILNCERKVLPPPCWLVGSGALIGDDSMTATAPAPRGRRKNDLMPTVPYDRTPAPKTFSSSTRKRSVSMTRLDQLAQPRKHYVEANKASSTVSSGASSMLKDTIKSPTRPLSSASEQSGGSGRLGSSTVRRVRSSPRKPRPVSIAGTVPDHKSRNEIKVSPIKKLFASSKKTQIEIKKVSVQMVSKVSEKSKSIEKPKTAPRATSTPKSTKPSSSTTPKAVKQVTPSKQSSSPKTSVSKKGATNKKKSDISSKVSSDVAANQLQETTKSLSPPDSPPPETAVIDTERSNAKRIISEEEAKAALAEKRRLAREQAEKEAELERQRQEELKQQEVERLRLEEEEQRRMEEEQLHLIQEHRRVEEEKLRKAIEENERKEEEERLKREEEQRLKAEQEKKAQEEAEKQRIELEEKLRKEEEERAERKKRLEKIMSRTRGKATGSSPSGSVSGSDQLDSTENPHENLSSGANSLDSNGPIEAASGPASLEAQELKSDIVSDGASMEAHPTYEVTSDNESLHDIVMPKSETASQDNSLVILPEKDEETCDIALNVESDKDYPTVLNVDETHNPELEIAAHNVDFSVSTLSNSEDIKDKNLEIMSDQVINKDKNVDENNFLPYENVKSIEVSEMMLSSEAHFIETSEVATVDHSEVILSFDDCSNAVIESVNVANIIPSEDVANIIPSEVSHCIEQAPVEYEIEQNSHFSTSSDIKLPDPIYETTSDEGSVSSEKHLQDGNTFEFQEEHHSESQHVLDEVFNEKVVSSSEVSNLNPFENQELKSSTGDFMAAYESQFEIGSFQDSSYAYETSDGRLPDAIEQPREVAEENIYPSRSSTSSVKDTNEIPNFNINSDAFSNIDENKENVVKEFPSHQTNPFGTDANEYDVSSNKENIQLISDNAVFDNFAADRDVLPENLNVDNDAQESCSERIFQQQEVSMQEQIGYENLPISSETSIEDFKSSNITIIKAEGTNDCIGIISSIDNDHISSDLTLKQNIQNEQLKSNFEYSSITDSEDSSVDSNLSQVMTGEVIEKNIEDINGSSEPHLMENGQTANPFSEPAINGSTDSKSNGDHLFNDAKVFSNGHRLEPSPPPPVEQIGDYVLDGSKHISSVDHPKTNIFDSVSAVDFGKMSPDPFLAKGSSNPNPFLLPEEQNKQVHLMTPDFFN